MRLSPTGWAVAAVSALSLGILGSEASTAIREVGGGDFDLSLAAGATLLLLALSCWTLTCIGLTLAAERAAAARMAARLITPRFARNALFLGAAGVLAIGPASAVGDNDSGSTSPGVVSRSLAGLHLPDRPVGATPPVSIPSAPGPHVIRVRPGDTLWSIAARDLGPLASYAEISAAVNRWYAANRARIGSDPDLIFPDLQLTSPVKDSR